MTALNPSFLDATPGLAQARFDAKVARRATKYPTQTAVSTCGQLNADGRTRCGRVKAAGAVSCGVHKANGLGSFAASATAYNPDTARAMAASLAIQSSLVTADGGLDWHGMRAEDGTPVVETVVNGVLTQTPVAGHLTAGGYVHEVPVPRRGFLARLFRR